MHPLVVRTEIDGFIADRLLEALWREALWLVNDDVATVAEIDDAISYGAGLRLALMGTFLTYRIAGGEAGMRHFLAQFGPALQWPWTKLTDVPELTDELVDKLTAQSDAQADGRSIRELEQLRDDCLVAVLQGLRAASYGAGETLAGLGARPARRPPGRGAPHRARVPADWVDYNGHVHESRYLQLFGDATDALLGALGVDGAYLAQGTYMTAETHLSHLRELHAGDEVSVTTQVLGADEKRLHVFHTIVRDGVPAATAEQMLLHVDAASGRVGAGGRRGAGARGPARGRAREPCRARSAPDGGSVAEQGAARDLGALFEPRSVAVVGVSSDESKWGYWFARDALKGAHRRQVFLVGRSGGELFGQTVYRSLADLPGAPELVILSVPASGLEQAVDESLAAGARALVAIAAGLGEQGAEGLAREAAIVERVRAAGAVLVGPNCLGVFDAGAELDLASNPLPGGPVGFISQSGNIALEAGLLLADLGLGFSRLVSVGNQADLDATELVTALAAHERDPCDRRLRGGFPRRPGVCRGGPHRRQAGRPAHGRDGPPRGPARRARTRAR